VLRPLLLTLMAASLAACNPTPPPQTPTQASPIVQGNQLRFPPGHPQLVLLTTTAAAPGKAITVELPSRMVWNEERTQRIYPAFAGRVTEIHADVGQTMARGAVLAQLASPDFGSAQADTIKSQGDWRLAQKTLQRQRELFEAGIIARKDFEQAETDATRAQAEAQRASARTNLYGASAGVDQQLALRANLGGVVVERNLNPGQEVRPDQSGPGIPALFVLTDPTSLWVQIDARESEAGLLKNGSTFELVIPSLPGQKFQGKVIATSDAIDPASRTIKIRGLVANPQRVLKAEMLATARIERTLGSGVVVPAAAITLSGTKHWLYVQTQAGVFEPREVTLGYEGPKQVVVSQGLEVGEQVVSDNVLLLARAFRMAQEEGQVEKPPEAPAKKATETAPISATEKK
jgi:cobalt-zinc-cadmium efflux system membrane fusion protein